MHLHEFFAMGGYAPYVWSAYGITIGVFVINLFSICMTTKQTRDQIKKYLASDAT